jgi:hypothetical protein
MSPCNRSPQNKHKQRWLTNSDTIVTYRCGGYGYSSRSSGVARAPVRKSLIPPPSIEPLARPRKSAGFSVRHQRPVKCRARCPIFLSKKRENEKYLSLQFKWNWTAETTWPVKKRRWCFSRKNSGTIICNFLYWQAESYVSFRFRFLNWPEIGTAPSPRDRGRRKLKRDSKH